MNPNLMIFVSVANLKWSLNLFELHWAFANPFQMLGQHEWAHLYDCGYFKLPKPIQQSFAFFGQWLQTKNSQPTSVCLPVNIWVLYNILVSLQIIYKFQPYNLWGWCLNTNHFRLFTKIMDKLTMPICPHILGWALLLTSELLMLAMPRLFNLWSFT